MSSIQVFPWKTTVCWVPSKVSRVPPSCWARSTPALYCVAVAQPARILRLRRVLHQWLDQALVHVNSLGGVGTQRAVGAGGAVGGEVVERFLERGGLADLLLYLVRIGVDGAVEDHRSNLVGVSLGVERSDPGAVRVAEIGQLVIAKA